MSETADSLDIASARSERNVKRRSDCQQFDQKRIRKIEIVGDCVPKDKKQQSDYSAGNPPSPMKCLIDGSLRLGRCLLRHHLRGENLKRQCDRGDENEQRVDSGSVAESGRAKESRDGNVVAKIDQGHEAQAGQHNGTAAEDSMGGRRGYCFELWRCTLWHFRLRSGGGLLLSNPILLGDLQMPITKRVSSQMPVTNGRLLVGGFLKETS